MQNTIPALSDEYAWVTAETVWVLQDANYNVMGLVDSDGDLVERYEYSPYGERKVFVSAGANDPGCYAPTLVSKRRWMSFQEWNEQGYSWITTLEQPFGLCEFGHQGFGHDEEIGIQIQRPRPYSPLHGWFMTRNHWGYIQNRHNLLEYELSSPTNYVEPFSAAESIVVGGAALKLAGGAAAAAPQAVVIGPVVGIALSFGAGYVIGSAIGDGIDALSDKGAKPIDTGDCTAKRYNELSYEKHMKCRGPDKPDGCTWDMSCPKLSEMSKRWMQCLHAREKLDTECFKGGDSGHVDKQEDMLNAARNCIDMYIKKKQMGLCCD